MRFHKQIQIEIQVRGTHSFALTLTHAAPSASPTHTLSLVKVTTSRNTCIIASTTSRSTILGFQPKRKEKKNQYFSNMLGSAVLTNFFFFSFLNLLGYSQFFFFFFLNPTLLRYQPTSTNLKKKKNQIYKKSLRKQTINFNRLLKNNK